jgi:hypothetical protein
MLLALTGCGGLRLVPVSGKVTVGGKPLQTGRVCFVPDGSRGNNAQVACVGGIGKDGRYELNTAGAVGSEKGKGAPPGWYKVTLMNKTGSTALNSQVKAVYFDEIKTPLSKEVVAGAPAGHYDIDFKPAK